MSAPPAPKKLRRSEIRLLQDDSVLIDDDEDDEDSPFTLYFVKLPDGNPTELELKNLEDTFKLARDRGVLPEWIGSEEVERLQASNDFFVLPCFRGKLFRRLQAMKIKVYGPPIVRECVEECKELPQWNHPIWSNVFEGAKISFTSIEPDRKRDLYEKVSWMTGVVGDSLYHETTHLVCGKSEQTTKYKAAVNNSIKLMREDWVTDLWETSKTTMGKFSGLVKDAINTYRLRVFEGLEMAVTSIDGTDRNNLIQLVEQHGGKVPGNMSRVRCKYLITDKTNGQKYQKAVEWGTVCVVQTRWIRKCVDLGHLIDEKKYHPKYLSAEHIRSSTPKKDTSVTECGPDLSSIAGPGGRLSGPSFSMSQANTQQSCRQSSFLSMTSTSNIAGTTLDSSGRRVRRSDEQSIVLARADSVQLVRSASIQNAASSDPIDDLRKRIDGRHRELFENYLFHICGVDPAQMDKWIRFLNDTGATRAPKFASATNVVVISPNQQERMEIRKYLKQEDITIVNVKWVVECVKRGEIIPSEGFKWKENDENTVADKNITRTPSNVSMRSRRSDTTIKSSIFANHTYYVHPEVGPTADHVRTQIRKNGGRLESSPEKAEFVVFGHSALMHKLMAFDTVITDFYIECSTDNKHLIVLSKFPLFIPLPRPPVPIFNNLRFVLAKHTPYVREYVKSIIETNGGVVIEKMDSKSYKIMLKAGRLEPEFAERTADFSWIVASMSQCRLQPIDNHRYVDNSNPLENYARSDDVWIKCTRERDSTEEMEVEVEERNRVAERPVEKVAKKNELSSPYENPYFPDLREVYKMNLNLDGVSEVINNMESPSRDTQETLTTSRVGSILRKAVVNTGRRETATTEKENEPATCGIFERLAVAENRRTVSSTPVLVRDVDRAMRYPPMDETFADQIQEHEELNRHYALHPHFLLSISNMDPQESLQLQEAIQQLGGSVEKEFNRDVTHLITSNMQRTPKVLSSIAAGKWCLTPDYIIKSTAAGRWLKEDPFEWCPEKLHIFYPNLPADGENRKILENLVSVSRLWRKRVEEMPITASVRMENRHNGAFSNWRCVIHYDDRKTHLIAPILEAGGAVVYSITDYIEVTSLTPNRVFAHKEFKWNVQSARMLKSENIPIYMFDVIYEYLIDKDNVDYSKFLHPVHKK